jgi:acyl-CoA thioester hydrolase
LHENGAGVRFHRNTPGGTIREQSPGSADPDLTDPAGYRHWTTITIRYRDLDPLDHINNAVYSEWFEAARVLLTRSFSAGEPDWLLTALARMTINFLAETTWPGEVEVGGRLLGIGNRSFRSAYGVFRDGHCLATAECVSVWFDQRARASVAPPAQVRQAMEAELQRPSSGSRPAR